MSKTQVALPWVQCPQCVGHGQIPMSPVMADTFSIVKKNPGIDAEDVFKISKDRGHVHVTAVNNRLVYLLKQGLLTRTKEGRTWKWAVKNISKS